MFERKKGWRRRRSKIEEEDGNQKNEIVELVDGFNVGAPHISFDELWKEIIVKKREDMANIFNVTVFDVEKERNGSQLLDDEKEKEEEDEFSDSSPPEDPVLLTPSGRRKRRKREPTLEFVPLNEIEPPLQENEEDGDDDGYYYSQEPLEEIWNSGKNCKNRTIFYHFLVHFKYHLLIQVKRRLGSYHWDVGKFIKGDRQWIRSQGERLQAVFQRVSVLWKEKGGGGGGGGRGDILMSGPSPYKISNFGECLLMWSDDEEEKESDDSEQEQEEEGFERFQDMDDIDEEDEVGTLEKIRTSSRVKKVNRSSKNKSKNSSHHQTSISTYCDQVVNHIISSSNTPQLSSRIKKMHNSSQRIHKLQKLGKEKHSSSTSKKKRQQNKDVIEIEEEDEEEEVTSPSEGGGSLDFINQEQEVKDSKNEEEDPLTPLRSIKKNGRRSNHHHPPRELELSLTPPSISISKLTHHTINNHPSSSENKNKKKKQPQRRSKSSSSSFSSKKSIADDSTDEEDEEIFGNID